MPRAGLPAAAAPPALTSALQGRSLLLWSYHASSLPRSASTSAGSPKRCSAAGGAGHPAGRAARGQGTRTERGLCERVRDSTPGAPEGTLGTNRARTGHEPGCPPPAAPGSPQPPHPAGTSGSRRALAALPGPGGRPPAPAAAPAEPPGGRGPQRAHGGAGGASTCVFPGKTPPSPAPARGPIRATPAPPQPIAAGCGGGVSRPPGYRRLPGGGVA